MRLSGDAARRFIEDVRRGVDDEELKKKYNLYGKEFLINKGVVREILAKRQAKLAKPTRKVNAHELLADIKAGMLDEGLMKKYNVSRRQLQRLFRKLIDARMVTVMELSQRLSITASQVREAFVDAGKAIEELD